MDYTRIIVTVLGAGLVAFTLWFFLGGKSKIGLAKNWPNPVFKRLRKWGLLALLALLAVIVAQQTILKPPVVKVVPVARRDVVAEVQGRERLQRMF
jgi:hypothetical protein